MAVGATTAGGDVGLAAGAGAVVAATGTAVGLDSGADVATGALVGDPPLVTGLHAAATSKPIELTLATRRKDRRSMLDPFAAVWVGITLSWSRT
jgi:hypothetical protein